jgi:hypothetical protein
MRAEDGETAVGAIVGKSLAVLDRGTGLLPVLLALR